jgi:hypothetical protein
LGQTESVFVLVIAPSPFLAEHRAALVEMPQELAHEERVARGASVERPGQGLVGGTQAVRRVRLDDGRDAVLVQAGEEHPLDSRLPPKIGQRGRQRVVGPDFGVAVGSDDEKRRRSGPQDVSQEGERLGSGPVQVVEDEDEQLVPGGLLEEGGGGVEEPVAVTIGARDPRRRGVGQAVRQLGSDAGELAAVSAHVGTQLGQRATAQEVAERLGERLVRDADLLVAAPVEHAGAQVMGLAGEVGDKGRLADTRFPADQHRLTAIARHPLEH